MNNAFSGRAGKRAQELYFEQNLVPEHGGRLEIERRAFLVVFHGSKQTPTQLSESKVLWLMRMPVCSTANSENALGELCFAHNTLFQCRQR